VGSETTAPSRDHRNTWLISGSWFDWEVAIRQFSEAERADIWDALERGESMRAIARNMGRAHASIRTWVLANAGRRPRPPGSSDLRLSLVEREEISRGLAGGLSLRAIARDMNRSPSTVCREVAANGGRRRYRALSAERAARRRARRPKVAKLAACPRLRAVVEAKLAGSGHPRRSRRGWLGPIPRTRRCGCPTRPST